MKKTKAVELVTALSNLLERFTYMHRQASSFFTEAFDKGKLKLDVNARMRSQARTVAIIMDEFAKTWDNGPDSVILGSKDYKEAFALLVKYATSHNHALKIHNVAIGFRTGDGQGQFRDNMKLLIVEELAALVKEEAQKLHQEDPQFAVQAYYVPRVRTQIGDIPRVEIDSAPEEQPLGSPAWAAKGFAIDVYRLEQGLYEAQQRLNETPGHDGHNGRASRNR